MIAKITGADFIPNVKIMRIKALPEALDSGNVGANVGSACPQLLLGWSVVAAFTQLHRKATRYLLAQLKQLSRSPVRSLRDRKSDRKSDIIQSGGRKVVTTQLGSGHGVGLKVPVPDQNEPGSLAIWDQRQSLRRKGKRYG